jgi:hypothetical protein
MVDYIMRLIEILNMIFRKLAYSNFSRHAEVNDLETNINIGYGYGLARTRDPLNQVMRIIRFCGPLRVYSKDFSLLDLGCGDGYMLRAFDFLRFRNLYGIEADKSLTNLARKNVPKATIELLDFTSSKFLNQVQTKSFSAIYTFNPCPAKELVPALIKLAQNGSYVLFLRNPISWPEISLASELSVDILGTPKNMIIARISSKAN